MAGKWLQRLGVAALLALVAGSIAALAVVRERLHVTVAAEEDAAQRGPDPVELLRADVADLRSEIAQLRDGVGIELQRLHDALEAAADRRGEQLAQRVGEVSRGLQSLRARIDEVALANARPIDSPTGAGSAPATAAIETPAPLRDEPQPPPAELAAPAPKSFLAFKLPSQAFHFDRTQRYALIPSLSRVGFDAKSTLHDFSGVTQKVEGELVANLAAPAEGCKGSIRVEAASLDTGLADRDAEMRAHLDVQAHPRLSFEWTAFEAADVDAAAMKLSGTARGRLTIRGVAREVAMPVRVSVDASKRLAIEGELRVRMSDFGVAPPSKLGVIAVEDELKLWIAVRARSLGPAEDASHD